MANTSANKIELLQIAESVAREKLIDPELVINALEETYARAAKSKYGAELDIRAFIDRKTGELTMQRIRTVVEEVENSFQELTVEDAIIYKEDAVLGDQLIDEIPPVESGRIAAQSGKQVLLQNIRQAKNSQ